ncbi:MAG: peptidylprolyl isomerase, partial [Magnetovibrionaceae bacterium]
ARKGISEEALRSQIEANMAWQKVVGRRLRSQVTVTEAEVNTMIDEMEARRGEPEYRIAEIFLAVESPSEEARVRTEINRIFAGLREGAPFRQLAENFSESASAAVGGDLGWVQRGELDPVIDQALQNLTPNQASPPLRTTNGYVIVFLIQKRLSQGLGVQVDDTFDIKQIFFDLPSNAAPAQVAQTNTRAEAIRRSATSCEAMDQLAKANGSPLSGDLGRMKSSDLPEAIRQAVSDLPVGRASAPVRTTAGLVVLMVCGREEGDVAAARATAFRNIENRLMQERLGVVARRYTRDLRRSAFIEIRQ